MNSKFSSLLKRPPARICPQVFRKIAEYDFLAGRKVGGFHKSLGPSKLGYYSRSKKK